MDKKKLITDEEKHLFRDTVKKITPLRHGKDKVLTTPPTKIKISKKSIPEELELPPFSTTPSQLRTAEEILAFNRGGIRTTTLNQLRRGQLKMEATLDLHRNTITKAYESLHHFIHVCRQKRIRYVTIIHGKGYHSKEGTPILKSMISEWLRNHPDVLAYHTAKPKDGGTGAVYVLLKTKRGD